MRKIVIAALAVLVLLPVEMSAKKKHEKQRQEVLNRNRGYYKDLFMDSGIHLTSRRELPSADSLSLAMEMFVSAKNNL